MDLRDELNAAQTHIGGLGTENAELRRRLEFIEAASIAMLPILGTDLPQHPGGFEDTLSCIKAGVEKLKAQRDALETALRGLVSKLDALERPLTDAFKFRARHGYAWNAGTYTQELLAAKGSLEALGEKD